MMNNFIYDMQSELGKEIEAGGILYPRSELEVSRILTAANRYVVPIYTERIKNKVGYHISLDKMGRINEICQEDFLAVIEAGTKVSFCKKIIEDKNLFFPLDDVDITIGAAVAKPINFEFKYYILGMRLVSPTGKILNFGGRTIKNVTGYNVVGFYSGARGLFGIITQVIIKLTPLPKFKISHTNFSEEYPQILYQLKKKIDPNNILNNHILG